MKRYQEIKFNNIAIKPCVHYHMKTRECNTGCKQVHVVPKGICPYDVEYYGAGVELQEECPCYK